MRCYVYVYAYAYVASKKQDLFVQVVDQRQRNSTRLMCYWISKVIHLTRMRLRMKKLIIFVASKRPEISYVLSRLLSLFASSFACPRTSGTSNEKKISKCF